MTLDQLPSQPWIETTEGVRVVVKDTGKHGQGVFAAEPICKGMFITTLSGERMPADVCNDMVRRGFLRNDDPLQINSHEFLVLDALSYSFNHGCDPNAGLRGESSLFALRDIIPGDEIRYDYSASVSPTVPISEWTMECGCGSANCRQRIGHVLTLPPEKIAFYLTQGAFQTYMLKELRQLGALLGTPDGSAM